jgi:hypothetical protein
MGNLNKCEFFAQTTLNESVMCTWSVCFISRPYIWFIWYSVGVSSEQWAVSSEIWGYCSGDHKGDYYSVEFNAL